MEARKQIESPYQRAARYRFPYHTRRGDGPFCLINNSRGTIELFEFEMLAQTMLAERNDLTLVKLVPDYGAVRNTNSGRLTTTAETVEFRR